MDQKDLDFEKTLDDSKMLLDGASRVADEDYEFTLEGILAEFGGKAPEGVSADAAPPAPAVCVTSPLPDITPEAEEDEEEDEEDASPITDVVPSIDTPQNFTLQEVLSRTVQDVLDEQKKEPVLEETTRRGLFSRKKIVETEDLYEHPDGPRVETSKKAVKRAEAPAKPPEPPAEPEPPIEQTVADYRAAMQNARHVSRYALLVTVVMWIPQLLDHFGVMPELYTAEPLLHVLPYFVLLALVCVLGREVFVYAAEKLVSFKITYELLTALLCVAALIDTAFCLVLPARTGVAAAPLHSIAALSMTCALWGRAMLFRSLYDSFRVAAIGDAPYMVTLTAGGAAKRSGSAAGFSTTAEREDVSGRWQTIVLPVVLVAAFVFSILATVEGKSAALFCWNLSAILAGANALAFPLVYSLPLRRLTKRFAKSGSALAGFAGADMMRKSNCVILTDTDLFPPGTVTLNGLKIFGEESGKVFSYAATMAHASETGLSRLFDNLLAAEGGHLEPLSDLNYYDEGGVSGTIHGETVLFGTSSFCRKMGVTLPHGLTLKTGMFLAVDGTLIAVFAVKYMAAENVDWAIHAIARAHITPVLAVRDGNITPALLKRKFGTDAHAVYPQLSTRLALSEKAGAKPCALIYREGLMPYAELAVGAKRLCRAVRAGNVLSLIASVAGTLLSFYLSFAAAYALFTPFKLLIFVLLWAVAALIDGVFVDKY
ncbi:MAG: hypothetical protein E7422_05435 [Ruminococcaceae bacterium]|nr:hypothetical protein [Oscillospiraceae bacterium]